MNVRVEYESTPIRHIAVQCPHCDNWFNGRDIIDGDWLRDLMYDYQISFAKFHCPICDDNFGFDNSYDKANMNIKEVSSAEECYANCLQKKEIWE